MIAAPFSNTVEVLGTANTLTITKIPRATKAKTKTTKYCTRGMEKVFGARFWFFAKYQTVSKGVGMTSSKSSVRRTGCVGSNVLMFVTPFCEAKAGAKTNVRKSIQNRFV